MNGHVRKIGNKWHYTIEMAKVMVTAKYTKGGWYKTEAQEHLRSSNT